MVMAVSMVRSDSILSRILLVVLLAIVASGCGVIGGIFKAGFWTGIVVVALIVIALVFVATKARG
jgi:hypothetical protein